MILIDTWVWVDHLCRVDEDSSEFLAGDTPPTRRNSEELRGTPRNSEEPRPLIASALIGGDVIWSRDKQLAAAAAELKVRFEA
jgi:hypothetical protein